MIKLFTVLRHGKNVNNIQTGIIKKQLESEILKIPLTLISKKYAIPSANLTKDKNDLYSKKTPQNAAERNYMRPK